MFCRNPGDVQCKYALGHGSGDTHAREDGQVFMSVFFQTGSTGGFMPHELHPDKYVQWVVVLELPSSTATYPKCPIVPWFLVVVS